jgi:hypothetical protein
VATSQAERRATLAQAAALLAAATADELRRIADELPPRRSMPVLDRAGREKRRRLRRVTARGHERPTR